MSDVGCASSYGGSNFSGQLSEDGLAMAESPPPTPPPEEEEAIDAGALSEALASNPYTTAEDSPSSPLQIKKEQVKLSIIPTSNEAVVLTDDGVLDTPSVAPQADPQLDILPVITPDDFNELPRTFSSIGRPVWSNQREMILVLMGYAIGIGNLWRFPYLVGRYGGGAFLLPYLLSLLIIGAPLFLMELLLGQKMQRGAVETFRRMHRSLMGIGFSSVLMVGIVLIYYNILLAWAIYYISQSVYNPLPWVDDPQGYFENHVLNRTEHITSPGAWELQWHLVICLAIVYCVLFLGTWKGIKSGGKMAYVTVTLPILLIVVLLLRVVFLPGAGKGVLFYITPRISALKDPSIWAIACGQILFSLSPCCGAAISLASYSKRDNMHNVNLIISTTNSGFSVMGGFVVFSVVGYMAQIEGATVEEIAKSGPELAFVVFPKALSTMPYPQLFSVIFFVMLFLLGVDSSLAWIETVATVIADYLRSRGKKVPTFTVAVSINLSLFLLGMALCTRGGSWWLDILDHYCPTYVLLGVAIVEPVVVHFFHGFTSLDAHLVGLTTRHIPKFLLIGMKISPVIAVVLVAVLLEKDIVKPFGDHPWWAQLIGWISAFGPLMLMPGVALWWWFFKREKAAVSVGDEAGAPQHAARPSRTTEYSEM
eukprot:TRINITY_DN12952_c0_g1_i1.p1 TRINITY_DN12952_c0_g1~~TRINITY_DN12952_c0_g1_i1.p1  ORF type:complete len:651 (+),score=56.33 TRINITY_DN12952_c0_g1_i1:69-2021(+)